MLNSSLLIVRSILCDTLKVQRYDRFLTYKEIMSKFIKKSVTSNQSSCVLSDYNPIDEIKIATFSVISENIRVFAVYLMLRLVGRY